MPSQARPPDSTSSVVVALTHSPGAVVDAADHQAEPGALEWAAMNPSAVMPSSIGSSARPTLRIWKKWSITQIESKPASSAVADDPRQGRADRLGRRPAR